MVHSVDSADSKCGGTELLPHLQRLLGLDADGGGMRLEGYRARAVLRLFWLCCEGGLPVPRILADDRLQLRAALGELVVQRESAEGSHGRDGWAVETERLLAALSPPPVASPPALSVSPPREAEEVARAAGLDESLWMRCHEPHYVSRPRRGLLPRQQLQ
jgi:hypothetical protein